MPALFLVLRTAAAIIPGSGPGKDLQLDNLHVHYHSIHVERAPNVWTFDQGVTATYGPTVVHADKITLHLDPKEKFGVAEGNVRIDDPVGAASATRLEFHWKEMTGDAAGLMVHSGHFMVQADSAKIMKDQWVLNGVYATPCDDKTPIFAVHAPKFVMTPDFTGKLTQPSLDVFGRHVISLKSYTIRRTGRGLGVNPPSVAYSTKTGFGIGDSSGFDLTDRTGLIAGFRAHQHRKFSGDLMLTNSLLSARSTTDITPVSDLEERFSYGYFENVYVRNPQDERVFLGTQRSIAAVGGVVRESATARRANTSFTKPYDVLLERSMPIDGFGVWGQARYQKIRAEGETYENRGIGQLSVLFPDLHLSPWLSTDVRFDGAGYFSSEGHNFTWARGQIGLVAEPVPGLRLGAAWIKGAESGTPDYEADRLYSLGGFSFRGDLYKGATKVSLIFKYDSERRKFYDNEILLRQAVGCLEPYIAYRSFPRGLSFGIQLRLDDLYDAIDRRVKMAQAKKK